MRHRYVHKNIASDELYGPFDTYGDAYTWASGKLGFSIHTLIEVPSVVDLRNRLDAELDDQFAAMS
jgi:hypothetical protein